MTPKQVDEALACWRRGLGRDCAAEIWRIIQLCLMWTIEGEESTYL